MTPSPGHRTDTATAGGRTEILWHDEFRDGLDVGGEWEVVVGGDGVPETTAAGLSVTPPGRNPGTGEPAFTTNVPAPMVHLKWLATSTRTFPTDGGELRFTYRAGARFFGTAAHPYGSLVEDPDADPRLATAVLHALDFESGMVLDFMITNTAVHPYYERILTGPGSKYHAFGSTGAPVPRVPGGTNDFCIAIDAASGTARWEMDGTTVATVDRLGSPAPAWTRVLDHGGTPQPVTPRGFQLGLGLLTLLDASSPSSADGLVDLGVDLVAPTSFHGGPPLFGQGARLDVERVTVERTS